MKLHKRVRISHFWRHFLEMFGAMAVGMAICTPIFVAISGVEWQQALVKYPAQSIVSMALAMTIPMAAWMHYRGMGRKNIYEMSAMMILPAIPFLCLALLQITNGVICCAYCAVTMFAMLGLMYYRRSEYSHDMKNKFGEKRI